MHHPDRWLVGAPHEGAQDFARRCTQLRPDVAGGIARVTQLYVHLRYGALADRQDQQRFERRVATFRVSKKTLAEEMVLSRHHGVRAWQ